MTTVANNRNCSLDSIFIELALVARSRRCSHLNTDDARAFLKSARTIPKGRENWTLWRCSIIYEARSGELIITSVTDEGWSTT